MTQLKKLKSIVWVRPDAVYTGQLPSKTWSNKQRAVFVKLIYQAWSHNKRLGWQPKRSNEWMNEWIESIKFTLLQGVIRGNVCDAAISCKRKQKSFCGLGVFLQDFIIKTRTYTFQKIPTQYWHFVSHSHCGCFVFFLFIKFFSFISFQPNKTKKSNLSHYKQVLQITLQTATSTNQPDSSLQVSRSSRGGWRAKVRFREMKSINLKSKQQQVLFLFLLLIESLTRQKSPGLS